MKSNRYLLFSDLKLKCWRHLFLGVVFWLTSWGCASIPEKLRIEGIPQPFDEGTIISTRAQRAIPFEALIRDLKTVRIIYIGEQHTHPAHHRIQLDVIRALYRKNPNLIVGMEMFDHTYQDILDLWSAGELDQKTFLRKVHWYANWRFNYKLYSDILDFIKTNHIRLVGLNIPNYIPPRIREGGIENLRDSEKKHLPDKIDTSNQAHRDYVRSVFDQHHHLKDRVDFEDFYAAQCVWEDGMAETIARNLKDRMMVVLAGNGHIIHKFGIPDRAYQRTNVSFRTIYPIPVGSKAQQSFGDYIWITPKNVD